MVGSKTEANTGWGVNRKIRYTYGLVNRGKSTLLDAIIKFDSSSGGGHKLWERQGHTPGEAIFVPDSGDGGEDAGVLLSVVLDGHAGTSYLLVLDAHTLHEVARADMGVAMPFGFHGAFVADAG